MRDFRDPKAMARSLRNALKARAVETTHGELLELISKAFGDENWNVLSAQIEAAEVPATDQRSLSPVDAQRDPAPPATLYCSFCGESQHAVRKLSARERPGPDVFICDECVDLCTGIVDPDDDKELFRLVKGTEGDEGRAEQVLLELARGTSTEELAHYVERDRRGVERNRLSVQGIQRRLAMPDGEIPSGDLDDRRDRLWLNNKTREQLVALQQQAQRELRQYEDALRIATAVLGERRQ